MDFAYFFAELSAILMSHIPRRRSDHLGYTVLLHIFGHIYPDHILFIAKECFCKSFESSVFPTPVGPRNKNEPIGRAGSFNPTLPRFTALESAWICLLPDQSHASPVFYPAFSGVCSQIHSVLLPGFVSTWKLHPQHLLQLPELFSFHSFY